MNKNWVKVIAAILFVGSIVVWAYGRSLEEPDFSGIAGPWTRWDYLGCAMIVSALGCSLAAYKLPDEDEDEES